MFLGISNIRRGLLLLRSKIFLLLIPNNVYIHIYLLMDYFVLYLIDMSKVNSLSQYHTLKVENPHEFVYNVQLNRPEKANAMNNSMWL